jgi:hypothetical protein
MEMGIDVPLSVLKGPDRNAGQTFHLPGGRG